MSTILGVSFGAATCWGTLRVHGKKRTGLVD